MTNSTDGQAELELGVEKNTDKPADGGEKYWANKAESARAAGASEATTAWFERAGQLYQKVLHNIIRGGGKAEVPGIPDSRYEQVRYWMRLHGPDNTFDGMRDDLVEAANMVTEYAPEAGSSPEETQAALIEAASTFAIAANQAETPEDRLALLTGATGALKTLDNTTEQMSFESQMQVDKGLLARAEQLREDLVITQIMETHNAPGLTAEAEAKLDKMFRGAHMRSLQEFSKMMENGNLTPQMALEWYTVIDARHQLLHQDAHFDQRVRGAYPHERNPAVVHGMPDDREFDESFTTSVETYSDGKWVQVPKGGRRNALIGGVNRTEGNKPGLGSIEAAIVEMANGEKAFLDTLSQGAVAMRKEMEMYALHGDWQNVSDNLERAVRAGHELVTA